MRNDFICPYCGKPYQEGDRFCAACGEPFDVEAVGKEIEKKYKYRNTMILFFLKYEGIMAILSLSITFGMFIGLASGMGSFPFFRYFLGILFLLTIFPICVVWYRISNKRRRVIDEQFVMDQASICPVCGSHDISLGRKGYDWNKGFWYSVFKVRGGHYLAGMDSRSVTAYCNKCGHKWETDRMWIK